MAVYNPNNLVPPDNPHAIWCDLCGEQVQFDNEDGFVCLLHNIIVHADCLAEYAEGLQCKIDKLNNTISIMVERDMS